MKTKTKRKKRKKNIPVEMKRLLQSSDFLGRCIKEVQTDVVGETSTIKTAKGSTINEDVVILGNQLGVKNMYTAMTRTIKNVYSCATPKK